MKKIALGVMVLITVLMMAGCSKQSTVTMDIQGVDVYTVDFRTAKTVNSRINENIVTFTVNHDDDYSFTMVDKNGVVYPMTLRFHDGKAECISPDGVTVNVIVK